MTVARPREPDDPAIGPHRLGQATREVFLATVLALGALAVLAAWWADASGTDLHSWGERLIAAGRVTALVGTYLVLVQVLLMARLPWFDRWIGTDRLAAWHRWNGQYTIGLLVAHTLLTVWGYAVADHAPLAHETSVVMRSYPDVLAATLGLVALVGVGISSARVVRRRLSYETWYFMHLYTYLAIALSFGHQLTTGDDFATHARNRALWVGLYVAVFGALIVWRVVLPVRGAFRHRLRVSSVVAEGPHAVSVYVTGRDLARLGARAGQFFRWRFLTAQGWWEAHPFSLSAAPGADLLRITAKGVGDHSRALRDMRPGVRVMAEGPYGNLTAARRTRSKVVLIAGGIGVTPLRSLLETLPGRRGDLTLLYRATDENDILFRSEIDELAEARGAEVFYLFGHRDKRPSPLGVAQLHLLVPDVADRDVFLCGPPGMMEVAMKSLRALGVPRSRIHAERFEL